MMYERSMLRHSQDEFFRGLEGQGVAPSSQGTFLFPTTCAFGSHYDQKTNVEASVEVAAFKRTPVVALMT